MVKNIFYSRELRNFCLYFAGKRNATRVQPQNTNNGDDSDAYDDSFIDDDSVEDFGASDDEETEFSDFDGSSSDEDSYPGPGRSKKKKFNIL